MVLKLPFKRSRWRGNTVDLFKITYGTGAGDVFRYTSGERPVTIGSDTYQPLAIKREGFKKGARDKGAELSITVPRTCEAAGLWRGTPPRRVVFIQVYEGDIPEYDSPEDWKTAPTVALLYSGRILDVQHRGEQTVFSCNNTGAGMQRPGLFRFYQRTCGHVLFGDRCPASKVAATSSFTVQERDPTDRVIDLPDAWADSDTRPLFVGGTLEWTGPYGTETRVIVAVGYGSVTVDSPVGGLLEQGDDVDLVLGCARTLDACTNVHGVPVSFGGTPYINEEDPHGKNNHT